MNKIDLPSADPDRVAQEIEDVLGLDAADVLPVSAKEGKGITELIEAVVQRVPPPRSPPSRPARRPSSSSGPAAAVGPRRCPAA